MTEPKTERFQKDRFDSSVTLEMYGNNLFYLRLEDNLDHNRSCFLDEGEAENMLKLLQSALTKMREMKALEMR